MSTAFEANDMDLDLESGSLEDQFECPYSEDAHANHTAAFARISVLLAHEFPEKADLTKALFQSANWATHCHRASSVEDLRESLQEQNWDLLVGYGDSTEFLPAVITKLLSEANSSARAIFLDDSYSTANALQIVQCGFHDYLTQAEEDRFLFVASREVQALHNEMHAQSSASVIAEAEAKTRLLLDTTTDAIAYVSDGMLIDANNAFIEALAYESAEDLLLMPLMDMAADQSRPEIRKVIKQLSKGERDIPSSGFYLLKANGESLSATIEFSAGTHDGEPCTQIILRGLQTGLAPEEIADMPVEREPVITGENSHYAPAENLQDLSLLGQINGKGMVYFISLCNTAGLRKKLDLDEYSALLAKVDEKIRSVFPDTSTVCSYSSENWVVAVSESGESENHLGGEVCSTLNQVIANCSGGEPGLYTAVGISKYGVAELTARGAADKAFNVCASQLNAGGVKVFAPRIDNAQGCAALRSAMELDRLKIKYQPVIGLHNQSTQWYEAFVYMRNDAGIEQDASELLESLGLEKDNVALDQWLVTHSIEALSSLVYENPHISLSVPLTASAIADEQFSDWLLSSVQASGLPKDCICFSVSADQAQSYEAKCKSFLTRLLESGFKTTIKGVASEQLDIVKSCKPDYVQLDKRLTKNLNAEENNSKEALKSIISQAGDNGAVCIAVGVNTAADLAQLWQTGIPYVQGSYLQGPLPSMNYEFSDIA
ncbi:MAG: EAL domain-containing protein [Pseudomonadales bacterium]